MRTRISLPEIPTTDRTPVVNMLLKVIEKQQTMIENQSKDIDILKSELKRLKKHKQKPKIRPSKMDQGGNGEKKTGDGKRPGSSKQKKTQNLRIDKTEVIKAENVPDNAKFKGYDRFIIQDIVIKTLNTEYKLERWKLVDGSYLVGQIPDHLQGQHFGSVLRSYMLHQYYNQGVTQPLLLDEIREWGVNISSGQLNRLLNENKIQFHEEKDELLKVGLSTSKYIQVDDTGARHQGKNGYCTQIGNDLFTWFSSTSRKSRINFLELLRADHKDYRIDQAALDYMKQQRLPNKPYELLLANMSVFDDISAWEAHLEKLGTRNKRHCRIATEGALIGSVLSHGFNVDLAILSDDAGQFNIFNHALCWIHAERKINELIPQCDQHAAAIDVIRRFFWQLYADLKAYKKGPTDKHKKILRHQFDALCDTRTSFELLNQVLKRLKRNKLELLLVLERPEIPLHNNLSENDIREYVKRRKISGGTRSDEGRQCRDTFLSLKKTCKKLGIQFWDYLQDRIQGKNEIPRLSDIIQEKAALA